MSIRKSLFSIFSARFFVFLSLAAVVSVFATPKVVKAHVTDPVHPEIRGIEFYLIPESALTAQATDNTGNRQIITDVWPPADFKPSDYGGYGHPGGGFWRERDHGVINGYVPLESGTGAPVGGIRVTSETPPLVEGDILAIAVRIGPVHTVHWGMKLDMSWDTGGPVSGTNYLNHWFYGHHLQEVRNEFSEYTVIYNYKVRSGDEDTDGGWFANNTPLKERQLNRYGGTAVNSDTLTFDVSTLSYPKIESNERPTLSKPTFEPAFTGWALYWRDEGYNLPSGSRWVQDENSPYAITSTPRGTERESRYAAFYETCFNVWDNAGRPATDTDAFRQLLEAAGCITTEGGIAEPAGLQPRPLGIYGVGETIRFHVKFSEPVWAETDLELRFQQNGGGGPDPARPTWRYATLIGSPTTHFKKPGKSFVRSDADNKLTFEYVVQEGDWAYGTGGIEFYFPFTTRHGEAQPKIIDAPGSPFYPHDVTNRFRALGPPADWSGGFSHMIDTFRANVQIERPAGGTDVVTGAFDIDMHFWNNTSSRGTPERVASIDTDAIAASLGEGWGVETELLGFNYQGIENDLLAHTFQSEVHRATFTPPLGFKGDVTIQVPENVAQDLARNGNLASNTLTVPIDTRLELTEAPEIVAPPTGAYAAGDKIEVAITYDRENLRYIGENPPYLTLYLGEEIPANARHATWESAEDANSTKVTFTYTVAAADIAASVSVAPIGITVPRGTTLRDDSGQQLPGNSEPAKKSGEGLETPPPPGQSQFQPPVGESDQGLAPRTEVPINLFILLEEETEPKADASAVPRSPIVFNELGNGSGDTNDWLEFRNVTGSDVSLKDWELSVVQDGMKEDTSLVVFPDVSVPANGLLLITSSNPTDDDNVLAGGDDVTTSEVEHKGSPHRYLVAEGLSLPDDGNFLLILRNAKEKLGLDEAFVDVAGGGGSGTDAFVRETTGDYDTHVWPLQVREAPGGNTEDALGSGKVWQRAKADIVGYHRDAWAEAAFTGIGYDRKVSQSAATAGTPGYPNGAVKTAADVPKGSITFSEIMVDSGGGTLPQWIELYNNSKTDAININRWKLEIQNVDSEELVGRPIVTLTLGEKLIQPNQTLLIVAGDARASSGTRLPSDRVYNLFKLHEKNLRIKSARDTFLSAEGFYLKLTDRNGTKIDEAGNIEGTRQRQESPDWILAMSREEGVRSSLIRRYTKGTSQAADGLLRGNWVLAAHVKKVVDGELHWGHADDIGTPGYRAGGALPVELSSFSVTREEKGAVVLTWTTESEVDNAGFNLRRSEKRGSGFTLINPALIAGAGTTGERQTYTFTDTSAKPGVEYYYQVEEVSFGGKPETLVTRLLPGPVSASNRALVTFGEVKQAKE